MDYRNFSFTNDGFIILCSIATHSATPGGNFRKNPDTVENYVYRAEHYENYITSIPFFNNWGDGASCRAYRNYTMAGYLPTYVVTVSPFRTCKKRAMFRFIPVSDMRHSAGYRENDIIDNAHSYELRNEDNSTMLYLYTNDGSGAIYDIKRHCWRG